MNLLIKNNIQHLYEHGIISYLDFCFAGYIGEISGNDDPDILLASALVSSYIGEGHICLDLKSLSRKQLFNSEEEHIQVDCPECNDWVEKLNLCSVVGKPGDYTPLVMDEHERLYLYRYWEYQQNLAKWLDKKSLAKKAGTDLILLRQSLGTLFPQNAIPVNWQKVAACSALLHGFCVISGGPGTGKTTTVSKILALLIEQAGNKKLRIALAAPTGKAASRLQESIKLARETSDFSHEILESIPDTAFTLHRLLGSVHDSPYFRYNADNPLPFDVVVIDEASMIDMPVMAKLVEALLPECRLIVLGDKDQLASVEAGAVLGDICDSDQLDGFSEKFCKDLESLTGYQLSADPERKPGIQDCIIQLRESYRFPAHGGIYKAALAVNEGSGAGALEIIKDSRYEDIEWLTIFRENITGFIRKKILHRYLVSMKTNDPADSFKAFQKFRILCAMRQGIFGAENINHEIEKILKTENAVPYHSQWYQSRPIMILKNDYDLRLFNGDIGITLFDPEAGNDLKVYFPSEDGSFRKINYSRLPEHETVFAMTVHKAQGSEFDEILLILPDRESMVISRELIYTGITRARKKVEIWGNEDVFRKGISRRIDKRSGLSDLLRRTKN